MNASPPNSPLTGSHSRLVRKPKPNCLIESAECQANAPIIVMTIATTSNAAPNIAARKIASPKLPVGESRLNRHFVEHEDFVETYFDVVIQLRNYMNAA